MLGALVEILLVVVSVDLVQSAPVEEQRTCYDPLKDAYPYYSTRTAYDQVHGNFSKPDETCKPLQVWMICRHGTKYPDKKALPKLRMLPTLQDQIVKNHEEGSGQLCEKDLESLKTWTLNKDYNEQMDEILAPQGKTELRLLAERLKQSFPDLLENPKPENFVFQSTATQRTIESMNSFAEGFFGGTNIAKVTPTPENDTLLQAFSSCPAWLKGKKAKSTYVERDKFTEGPEIVGIMKIVSERLGFKEPFDIQTLTTFYDACRFESALNRERPSVWCSVFTKEELKIIEYREDVEKYYYVGPGQKISPAMNCWLLADMFQHFNAAASESEKEPKGVFYFGHTKNLQTLLTTLKIGADEAPLTATGYPTSQDRKFRSSILGPFATNIIAVLHKCGDGMNKVTFHVAERLTTIASCKDDGTCELKALEEEFKDRYTNCNLGICF